MIPESGSAGMHWLALKHVRSLPESGGEERTAAVNSEGAS